MTPAHVTICWHIRFLSVVLFAAITAVAWGDESGTAAAFVPPGFEELLEPQTTVVDVYYGGAFLLSTPATFTPTDISFLEPSAITDHIPDLLEPDVIEAELAAGTSTNAELVCLTKMQTGCGKIETDTVAVIFDDGRFRADIFIAPHLLSVRPATVSKFLPPSSAGLSLLNSTAATVNGVSGEIGNYNIGNSTTLAWRENRILGISNYTNDEDFTVDALVAQREVSGRQLQAGVFRSSAGALVFLRQADFRGFSIASSLDTRRDLDQSAGNSLQVFLDSRSRVDIFKDGRLVSTGIYDTGNQILDTSQLPDGAYEVTLRIRDNFGDVREETRFYVKTNRLPPIDQPLYFLDIGEVVLRQAGDILPDGTGETLLRAGVAKRLSDDFGGEIGVMQGEDATLAEAGFFHLGRSYELRLNAAVGDDHSRGVNLNARARLGRSLLNANLRKTWADSEDAIVGPQLTQAALNLTVPVGRSSLSVTSRYNSRPGGTDRNVGVRYDFPTWRLGDRIVDLSLQWTRNNGSTLVLLGGRLALRSDRWQTRVSSQVFADRPVDGPDETGVAGNVSATWQDGDRYLSDVALTLRADEGIEDRTVEAELDVASNLGRANVETVWSHQNDELSYGGSLFTSIIANGDTFAIGSRRQAQSAVVLDIRGQRGDAWFDVEIDSMRRGGAQIGDKTIIGLTPYDTYDVSLLPRGSDIVDFDIAPKQVTLYPGNVVTLGWDITRVLVAFGQILLPDGTPVAGAVIEGVIGLATTDDFGLFQAEIRSSVERLQVRTREMRCEVELPPYDTGQLVVTFGELTCQ